MAGTRLLLQTTFLIEILTLTILASYLGLFLHNNNQQQNATTSKENDAIFVDRSGYTIPPPLLLLDDDSSSSSSSMSLKRRLKGVRKMGGRNIQFNILGGRYAEMIYIMEVLWGSVSSRTAVEVVRKKRVRKLENAASVVGVNVEDWCYGSTDDDEHAMSMMNLDVPLEEDEGEGGGEYWHPILIVTCPKPPPKKQQHDTTQQRQGGGKEAEAAAAKVTILPPTGTILVRLYQRKNLENLCRGVIADGVGMALRQISTIDYSPKKDVDVSMTTTTKTAISEWHISLTLIDEDPTSWTTSTGSTKKQDQHSQLLMTALNDVTYGNNGDGVSSFIQKSMNFLLGDVNNNVKIISVRYVPYGSLSDTATKSLRYTNQTQQQQEEVFVLQHKPQKTMMKFWENHRDILSVPKRYRQEEGYSNKENILDWVLYVPQKQKTPLYIVAESDDETTTTLGTALSDGKGNMISIVNLHHRQQQQRRSTTTDVDPTDGENSLDESKKQNDGKEEEQTCTEEEEEGTTHLVAAPVHGPYKDAIREAMSYFIPLVRTHFLGLPPIPQKKNSNRKPIWEKRKLFHDKNTGNVTLNHAPATQGTTKKNVLAMEWEVSLILRQSWTKKYKLVLEKLTNQLMLMKGLQNLAVPKEVGSQIHQATQHLQSAYNIAIDSHGYLTYSHPKLIKSTAELYAAFKLVREIETNDTIMEPLHFPFEHYMAVLAPLVLPLLLPLVIGLIRELKRYRKLVEKKKTAKKDNDEVVATTTTTKEEEAEGTEKAE